MSSREGAVCITYTECASWTHSRKTVLSFTTERKCSLTAQVSSLHFECIQLKDGCVPVCANLAATIDPDEPSSKILRKTARTSEFSALTPWSADRTPWCHENAAQVSLSRVNPQNNRNGFQWCLPLASLEASCRCTYQVKSLSLAMQAYALTALLSLLGWYPLAGSSEPADAAYRPSHRGMSNQHEALQLDVHSRGVQDLRTHTHTSALVCTPVYATGPL